MHAMNLASLDLNLLVALEALLDEASVGRAAERVALSQPAMSHALKRLRGLFDDALLVRVGARMQLTARGEALCSPVQDALSLVRGLLQGERFDPGTSTRMFRLFASDYPADLLLPPLLKRLRGEAPKVSIQLHAGRSSSLDAVELAREVDAAIACVPKQFKGFYQQRLFADRDACAVRRGHALTKRMNVESFLRARHVAVVGREFREDPVDTWLREEGHDRSVAVTVEHYLQALHVVGQSEFIAVIPARLIRAQAEALGILAVPVPLDAGTFDEYLLHPARTHADAGCVWLRRVLKEIAVALGPLDGEVLRKTRALRRRRSVDSATSRRMRKA